MKLFFIILTSFLFLSGCADKITAPEEVVYSDILEINGLIDSLGGDCSGVIIRTRDLGNFNLSQFEKLKFELNNSSDADLAAFQIYYTESGNNVFLVNIEGENITGTRTVEINSPKSNVQLNLRIMLKSSVCTGHIYHLTVKDLKIKAK